MLRVALSWAAYGTGHLIYLVDNYGFQNRYFSIYLVG